MGKKVAKKEQTAMAAFDPSLFEADAGVGVSDSSSRQRVGHSIGSGADREGSRHIHLSRGKPHLGFL